MAAVSVQAASARGELGFYGLAVVPLLDSDEAANFEATASSALDVVTGQPKCSNSNQQNLLRFWNDIRLQQASNLLAGRNSSLHKRYSAFLDLISERTRTLVGNAWHLCPDRSYFLRIVGKAKGAAWRADADTAVEQQHSINIWLPLDAGGADVPSLDLVPGSHQAMRAMPRLSPDNGQRDAFVRSIGGYFTPQLFAGDAVAIDKFTLYRTRNSSSALDLRAACEFQFRYVPWHRVSTLCRNIGRVARDRRERMSLRG